jgi:hypothetical protein
VLYNKTDTVAECAAPRRTPHPRRRSLPPHVCTGLNVLLAIRSTQSHGVMRTQCVHGTGAMASKRPARQGLSPASYCDRPYPTRTKANVRIEWHSASKFLFGARSKIAASRIDDGLIDDDVGAAGRAGRPDGLTPRLGIQLVAPASKLLSMPDGDAWATNSMLLQSYRLRVGTSADRMRNAGCVDLMFKNGVLKLSIQLRL